MQIQTDPIFVRERLILSLSRECAISIMEVENLYKQEWERLSAQARLTEFLPVLVGRGVRDAIRIRKNLSTAREVGMAATAAGK